MSTNTNTKPDWRKAYPPHPAADVFPMMPDDQLDELAKDIERNGMREEITFMRNGEAELLLDGRNRLEAWTRLGRNPHGAPCRAANGDDPAAIVISANIRRRHLTPKQRVLLADKAIKAAEEHARVVGKVAAKSKGRPKSHATKVAEAAEVPKRTARDVLAKEKARRAPAPVTVTHPDGSKETVSQAQLRRRKKAEQAAVKAPVKEAETAVIQEVEDHLNEALFGKAKPKTRRRNPTEADQTLENIARNLSTINTSRITPTGIRALKSIATTVGELVQELSNTHTKEDA